VLTRVIKRTWLVISIMFSKLKNFSRSHAANNTAKVVVCLKWCKIETHLYAGLTYSS